MRYISRAAIGLLCFFALELAIFTPTAFSQGQDTVLVKIEPPLTQGMVDRIVDFFQWSLGVRLSAEQKTEVQQSLITAWKRNDRAEIYGTWEDYNSLKYTIRLLIHTIISVQADTSATLKS
jgi:hypothetical protein